MSYVLLGTDSQQQAVVLGSKAGRPLMSESAAERVKERLQLERPKYDWIILPLQAGPRLSDNPDDPEVVRRETMKTVDLPEPEANPCRDRDRGVPCVICNHEHCGWCPDCHPEVPEW
jgi:hypothetical protein